MIIPKKVSDRLNTRLRPFQTILKSASDRDVNESDTVTIIIDMLADLFGFDKYAEITKEYAIKATWCGAKHLTRRLAHTQNYGQG